MASLLRIEEPDSGGVTMAQEDDFLRSASPNEQRTISRENLGHYCSVVVGGLYKLPPGFDVDREESYYGGLARCIEQNPYLCVTIGDPQTSKSFYKRAGHVNLDRHVDVLERHEVFVPESVDQIVLTNLDKPWSPSFPPWKLVVQPYGRSSAFIAFVYAHSIGDGPTGLSVHRHIIDWLVSPSDHSHHQPAIIKHLHVNLPEPFDTSSRLPISWSFLLRPLLGVHLPDSLAYYLGISATAAEPTTTTWRGALVPNHARAANTRLRSFSISATQLSSALAAARAHKAKLTGLLHQLIVTALSDALPVSAGDTFLAQTDTNLRPTLNLSVDEPGQWVSIANELLPRQPSHQQQHQNSSNSNEGKDMSRAISWSAARHTTELLAASVASTRDQSVGLLRYLPNVRSWLEGKRGKQRDATYEVSNIGVLETKGMVESMVFAQPGHVTGVPLAFNFVSVKEGPLTGTVTWSAGALGLGNGGAEEEEEEEKEGRFVERIVVSIKTGLESLGEG